MRNDDERGPVRLGPGGDFQYEPEPQALWSSMLIAGVVIALFLIVSGWPLTSSLGG